MRNLGWLKSKSFKEQSNIPEEYYNNTVRPLLKKASVISVDIPKNIDINLLEDFCESQNLPMYRVTFRYCTFADTYTNLYEHEAQR